MTTYIWLKDKLSFIPLEMRTMFCVHWGYTSQMRGMMCSWWWTWGCRWRFFKGSSSSIMSSCYRGHQVAAWRWLWHWAENGVLNFPGTSRMTGTGCQCQLTARVLPPLSPMWGSTVCSIGRLLGGITLLSKYFRARKFFKNILCDFEPVASDFPRKHPRVSEYSPQGVQTVEYCSAIKRSHCYRQ